MIKKNHGSVSIGALTAGVDVKIEYSTLESENPGPIVHIQGGMHGGELTFPIIKRLFEELQTSLLCGKIVFVPIANPFSWLQRIHYTTIGKYDFYDGKDWNRNFPGNAEGSLAERVAIALASLSESAEYIVDLHTSRNSVPFGIVCETSIKNEIIDLFPCDFIQLIKQNNTDFTGYTTGLGKKSICLECGPHDTINTEYNDSIVHILLSGLSKLGMIDYSPVKKLSQKDPTVFSELNDLRSVVGGYIQYNKIPGDTFIKNDLLYTIIPYELTSENVLVVAETDGMVLKISPTNILRSGDSVMQIIDIHKAISL